MIVINLIYVSAEFIFNFVLLNTASTQVELNDIHTVEILGRSLAAFGFTFIFWKTIQNANMKTLKKVLLMAVITCVTYPAFYFGQAKFVNSLAENSSLETREQMNDLFLLKQGLINGSLQLNTVPYNEAIKDLPESKTFISNISLFMLNNEAVKNYIKSNKEKLAANVFIAEVQNNPKKYSELYSSVYYAADDMYRSWYAINEQKKVNIKKAGYVVDRSYADMEKKLKWKYRKEHDMSAYVGMSYTQYVNTASMKALIRDEVKKTHNMDLTRDFNAADINSLRAAMQGSVYDQYAKANVEMKAKYGFVIPDNLSSREEFYALPGVQKMLKEKLGNLYFPNNYGDTALRGLDKETDNIIVKNNAETIGAGLAKEFLKKDLNSPEVTSIVKAMIVPPIALILSLLFAFINLFILVKSIAEKLMIHRVKKPKMYSNVVVAVLVGLLISFPMVLGNKYTESESYQKVYANMDAYNPLMAHCVDWIMKFEPFVYGYGETFIKK